MNEISKQVIQNRYVNLYNRDVCGILLLDKPSKMSSSFVLKKIKRLFCANKVGHTGTLDFLATGMLPVCFGKATKFAKFLLNSDKKYRVLARLGESTNTFDANGKIIQRLPIQFSDNDLERCLRCFQGQCYQIPPMFSSLKYNGLPLYKYAQRGINIRRQSRMIHVFNLNIINKTKNTIELDIHCSKGTYIRSIINDIGEYLGCGAHVIKLRRLMVGKYSSDSMINIQTLESIFYDSTLSDVEVLNKFDQLLIKLDVIN